jgi:hypothetical protein
LELDTDFLYWNLYGSDPSIAAYILDNMHRFLIKSPDDTDEIRSLLQSVCNGTFIDDDQ